MSLSQENTLPVTRRENEGKLHREWRRRADLRAEIVDAHRSLRRAILDWNRAYPCEAITKIPARLPSVGDEPDYETSGPVGEAGQKENVKCE